MTKTAFIGHRNIAIYNNRILNALSNAIKKEINGGCRSFIMGTHGNFDKIALSTCRSFKNKGFDLEIEVVIKLK